MSSPRRANVAGLGLIGGSIALALRERGWHVTGDDLDAGTRRAGAARWVPSMPPASIPTPYITFVATPVLAVADRVKRALAESSGLVTDVGSVKGGIAAAIDDPRFVGGHPMAGSELDGFDGADASMFEGAVWVLTPSTTTADSTFSQVAAVVAELGADVVALPADRHDQVVAVISHVPHLAAATLMGLASDRAEEHAALLRLAAGGFRDMTRIASGHPAIWLDICAENRPAILSALDGLIERSRLDARRRRPRRPRARCSTACSMLATPAPTCRAGSTSRASSPRCASRSPTARAPPPRCSRSPPSSASTSPASKWCTASRATAVSPSCSSTWPPPSCTAVV